MSDEDDVDLQRLLDGVWATDKATRQNSAATLSKIAAKANDPMLEEMSVAAPIFVELLAEDEPLLRAYTACIIANIAFLEIGQRRVLEAGGIPPMVRMLKEKDRKVQLHSSAAVQNLTYKNAPCCEAVLAEGGEKALNKLLRHKSDDIQQFAAGALANLQLYRRQVEIDARGAKMGKLHQVSTLGLALDQKNLAKHSRAATSIQAALRGHLARVQLAAQVRLAVRAKAGGRGQKNGYGNGYGNGGKSGDGSANGFGRKQVDTGNMVGNNKYDVFRVKDARSQLDVQAPSLPPIGVGGNGIVGPRGGPMSGGGMGGGGGGGGMPLRYTDSKSPAMSPPGLGGLAHGLGGLSPGYGGLPSLKGGPRRLEPLGAIKNSPR
mmetsp:Transcript_31311/g.78321  ORF Transcript_31311/g.78321 Transcript_31311/m.78321 type:complete len:377 (-) Transcript_31311:190-1320(-)